MNKIYKIGELPFKFISRKQDETFTIFESDQCIIKILTETLNNRSSIVKELTNEEDFSEMEKTFVQKLAEELEKQGLADSITVTLDNTDCLVLSNVDTEEELVIGNESVEDIRNFLKFLINNDVSITKANIENFAKTTDQKLNYIRLFDYCRQAYTEISRLVSEGIASFDKELVKMLTKAKDQLKKLVEKQKAEKTYIKLNQDPKVQEYFRQQDLTRKRHAKVKEDVVKEQEKAKVKLSNQEKQELLKLKETDPKAYAAEIKKLKTNFAEDNDIETLSDKQEVYKVLQKLVLTAKDFDTIPQDRYYKKYLTQCSKIAGLASSLISRYNLDQAKGELDKKLEEQIEAERKALESFEKELGLDSVVHVEDYLPETKADGTKITWPKAVKDLVEQLAEKPESAELKKQLKLTLKKYNDDGTFYKQIIAKLDNESLDLSAEPKDLSSLINEKANDTVKKSWSAIQNKYPKIQEAIEQYAKKPDADLKTKVLNWQKTEAGKKALEELFDFIDNNNENNMTFSSKDLFMNMTNKYVMNFDSTEVSDHEFGRCFEDKFGSLWSTDPDKDPKAKLLWESKDGKVETTKVSDSTLSDDEMDDTLSQDIESDADLEGDDDDFDLGSDDAGESEDLGGEDEDLDLEDESFSEDDLDFDLGEDTEEDENTDSDEDFDLDFDLEEEANNDDDNLALQAAKDTIKEMTPIIEKLIDKIK